MDGGCPSEFATISRMNIKNRKRKFMQAVQVLAADDQFILEAAHLGYSLEELLHHLYRSRSKFPILLSSAFVAAFRRNLPSQFYAYSFRKPELRGWCLVANGISKVLASTPFHGWFERNHHAQAAIKC